MGAGALINLYLSFGVLAAEMLPAKLYREPRTSPTEHSGSWRHRIEGSRCPLPLVKRRIYTSAVVPFLASRLLHAQNEDIYGSALMRTIAIKIIDPLPLCEA